MFRTSIVLKRVASNNPCTRSRAMRSCSRILARSGQGDDFLHGEHRPTRSQRNTNCKGSQRPSPGCRPCSPRRRARCGRAVPEGPARTCGQADVRHGKAASSNTRAMHVLNGLQEQLGSRHAMSLGSRAASQSMIRLSWAKTTHVKSRSWKKPSEHCVSTLKLGMD
jgi:hypothetical protein